MPGITESDLKKHIAGGAPGPLYLLFGEEKLTLKRAASKLIAAASHEGPAEFNRALFNNDSGVEGIAAAVEALPFMAPHKCAAVSDFDPESKSSEELDRLCSLMEDLPESSTLVFYYPTLDVPKKRSPKWKKLMDRAGKYGCTVEFGRLPDGDLYKLLKKEAERQGCGLQRRSFDRLLSYAGNDLNGLRQETEKLCAYALGCGQGDISPEMVEDLTPKSTETTAFKMVRALTSGRYEEAYGLLDQLFARGEQPVGILAAIASAYVDMYRVKSALESGLTGEAVTEYAPEYKGQGYRLQNAGRSCRSLSLSQLRDCLGLLLDADMSLKGSKLEPRLVLEGLMSRLLLAVQG